MAEFKLKDICEFNKFGVKDLNKEENINYLDTSNLVHGDVIEYQKYLLRDAPSRAQRKVEENTILYSLVRPNLCHYGFIPKPVKNLVASTGFVTINLKQEYEGMIDIRFVYLLLTQNWLTEHLHTIAENAVSAYPSLNPSDIENLSFNFPPTDTQKQITTSLFDLQNKIDVNREINRNLPLSA